MNTEAMQRARKAAQAKRDAEHVRGVRQFRAWSRRDAELYARKREAIADAGYFTPAYNIANEAWHEHLRAMPVPPPDYAWRLERALSEGTAA